MRIQRSIQHKYCADGSFMKEFLLDAPLTRDFFTYLGNFGQIGQLQNLGGGFCKFEKTNWFSIKGFVGDTTVEVRFKKESMELTVDFLYLLFSSYHEGTMDLSVLKNKEKLREARVNRLLYGK